MAKYNYIVDLSEQFEGKPETAPSEGVMGKPVTEKAEKPKSMYQEMADMLSAYWGGTDEAKARVAPGSVKEADEDEISVYTDWEEAALRSAEESAIFRMDMGITESLAEPQIRKKLPEGATYRPLQRPGPVLKEAEDALVTIPESEPVTVEDIDAKPAGGLMARPKARPTKDAEEDTFLTDLTEFLKEEESFRAEPYTATRGEEFLTIGYGHYGPDVKKGQKLTQAEAEALLVKDIKKRLPAIRKNITEFDNLSSGLKVQIAQSWFRGGIAGSPKTIRLINQGKFSEAADEFLDNDEYRNAEQRGRRGVIKRMDGLADALREEAN